ncbi:GNAT family N-acetyltransferase [Pseudoalteromonas sp. NBT06-2]|uniref:GNAT family N-acetyltransferase n=1 Tax=Pseudoalteromonas sp. NBT06-2 TaxID=2025950 RepID=UPI001481FD44|nr:GNAT family N-acetyltransferase [Pseudoalteromonas sp. NBT06-2]
MNFEVTDKIKLIPLKGADAHCIFTLVEQSRVELGQYLYWVKDVINIKTAEEYILKRINSGLVGSVWFKIQFNNEDCGIFAIKSVCKQTGIAELGYWLSHYFYKKGIISDIVNKLPQYLIKYSDAKIIEFRCLEDNLASISIAKKSGAKFIKSLPEYMEIANSNQNLNIYQVMI